MTEKGTKEVVKNEETQVGAEATRPEPVYTPLVDIFEDQEKITLVADMPGVSPERLKLDLNEGVLRMRGEIESPVKEGEVPVIEEFRYGAYEREFKISEAIDQEKIEARISSGVLTLLLPKAESVKPRKITVQAG